MQTADNCLMGLFGSHRCGVAPGVYQQRSGSAPGGADQELLAEQQLQLLSEGRPQNDYGFCPNPQ